MILCPPPDPATAALIKISLLAKLNRYGLVRPSEMLSLATGHVDDVLDRVFEHCPSVRVSLPDGQSLEIRPGGTAQ